MANIATLLKAEISRVTRKQVRTEIQQLRKASAAYRGAIAQLRRQVADLEKQLKLAKRPTASQAQAEGSSLANTPRRFSAARLAAHRAKLGLSAAAYGNFIGVSGATIYLWEQGKSRPNPGQLLKIADARKLTRTAVAKELARSREVKRKQAS